MKIIDIGICVDNRDPENLGRIRCMRYSAYTGQIERAFNYNAWDDKDLFTANPFLPTNINFIPEIGQTVKLLNYNTEKENVNLEYVAGPFTTRHDYNSQTHAIQVEKTTYGIPAKHGKSVIDANGNYINPKSNGVFATHTDYGVYGKYGSDIIFTENGIQLRGGKLNSKNSVDANKRKEMLYQPLMSKKMATLHLKKFESTKEFVSEEQTIERIVSTDLNHMVEYSISAFTGTTYTINYYVYKINKTYGDKYKTNNNGLSEVELLSEYVHLINNDNTTTTPTISKVVDSLNAVYITIRNDLKTLHYKNLFEFESYYQKTDLHPFYFRPTTECRNRTLNTTEETNRTLIFNKIYINDFCGPQYGLVYQKTTTVPPINKIKKIEYTLKEKQKNTEQTFSALKSDKIFLLSTDSNITSNNPINFENLDKYELTQENYLKDIEPHTSSLVRGEPLLAFLRALYDVLTTHVHNINDPYARTTYSEHENLLRLYKKLEEDILNKSIKLN
jgi:hypothetical protein